MTNQRFSLSRLTIGGLLVLAACGASAQEAARNPNPFQAPQVVAAPSAPASTPALPPATTARSAADTGPLTLPPPIPVPLEKMLPKLAPQPAAPATSTTPVPPPPPANKADDAVASTQASGGAVPPKVRAFLPREKIEASRARCQVTFKGRNLIQLTASDTEQVIQMTGAHGCLTAISADTDWLDVEYRGNNELMLMAQANTGKAARRGQVTVVTPNQTFVLTIRQAAESAEPAIAPKEKAPAAEPSPSKAAAVPVSATVPAEPEYDAAKARLADVGDQPLQFTSALKSLAGREPVEMPLAVLAPLEAVMPTFSLLELVEPKLELLSLEAMKKAGPSVSVDMASLPKAAMPQFDLPEVNGPPLELRSLALLQQRAPSVIAEVVPTLSVPSPQFALPDVRGAPLELRSLAALRDRAPSVAILSADQLQHSSVSLSLPALPAPVATIVEPIAPTPAQQATPSVDPTRAKAILDAVFSATEPNFGEAPAAVTAKPAPTRPAYVPPGYVTLDEYTPAHAVKDVPKPAKKRTK